MAVSRARQRRQCRLLCQRYGVGSEWDDAIYGSLTWVHTGVVELFWLVVATVKMLEFEKINFSFKAQIYCLNGVF